MVRTVPAQYVARFVRESFAVTDDGVRLWTASAGAPDGRPVVLCHGGPGLWDNLAGLAALLESEHTVVRWEQRGCGRSDRVGPYTMARFVADLDCVREHHGFEKWTVGGHSWGAALALHYALAHPSRVDALLYVSGVGIGRAWNAAYHAEADRRLTDTNRARRNELQSSERSVDEEREYRALTWAPDFADRSTAFELALVEASAPFVTNYECNATLGVEFKQFDEADLAARCRSMTAPALVVHGAEDPRPSWAIDSLSAALPDCETHVLLGLGHLPWLEDADAVRAVLVDFCHRKVTRHGAG